MEHDCRALRRRTRAFTCRLNDEELQWERREVAHTSSRLRRDGMMKAEYLFFNAGNFRLERRVGRPGRKRDEKRFFQERLVEADDRRFQCVLDGFPQQTMKLLEEVLEIR